MSDNKIVIVFLMEIYREIRSCIELLKNYNLTNIFEDNNENIDYVIKMEAEKKLENIFYRLKNDAHMYKQIQYCRFLLVDANQTEAFSDIAKILDKVLGYMIREYDLDVPIGLR